MRPDDELRLLRLIDGATDPSFYEDEAAAVGPLLRIADALGALVMMKVLEDDDWRRAWEAF